VDLDGLAGRDAQGPTVHLEGGVELDFDTFIWPGDFPRVGVPQPVVRSFVLPAVLDGLAEDSVLVAQAVSHGRQLERRHRVEKAGGQPPQPAVAQARVGLLLEQLDRVKVSGTESLPGDGIQQQVRHVVGQRAAEEEFHRQVIDPLGVFALVGLLGPHPALAEDIADGTGERLEAVPRPGGCRVDDVVEH
jgi:hypothetical protein